MKVIRLILTVHYDEATTDNNLESLLEQEVTYAIGNNLLTPSGNEIVDEWNLDVETLEKGYSPSQNDASWIDIMEGTD
tara:strand:+ start:506 stop:739 length:234 start_codon:yes stop_codon:yes gene_type:complete